MDKKFWESKKVKLALAGATAEGLMAFVIAFAADFGIEVPVEVLAYIAGIFGVAIGGTAAQDVVRLRRDSKQINLPQGQSDLPQSSIPGVCGNIPFQGTGSWAPDSGSADAPPMDNRREFDALRESPWMLTDISNPAIVKRDFLGHFEVVFEAAKRMYEDDHGYAPTKMQEPCQTGDWSYSSRWLWHSWRELTIQTDMVEAIGKDPALKYKLMGVGYLLQGIPWEDIPQTIQDTLSYHIVGMKPVWRFQL